jgi:hypothetical protein
MALINTSVPNLIQGVSQQPDATRFDGQCEEQVNALSSVAEGLKKRPNTRHVARLLEEAIDEDSFVHFINRSDVEKYVVIHDGACLKAWNILTGNEATINGSTGGYTPASGSYLDASSPRTLLKALTVADTTFVLNNQKGVALDVNHTPALDKEALVLINQGDYKKKYEVNVTLNPDQLSGFQAATATAVLERYTYSSVVTTQSSFITTYTTTITYRWRVASLNLTGVGAGYPQASLSFASDASTYQNASGTVAVDNSDGSIDSLTLVSNGEYAGTGYSFTNPSMGNYIAAYGETPPNISVNITANAGLGASSTTLSSFIWSGTSANSNNSAANTDSIASWLSSNSDNSGFNTSSDRPMDVADGNGNKFTDFFDISISGSLIKLIKKNNWSGDFTISTSDSLADDGMTAIYKEVSTITDLPAKCFNGFRVKVIGDTEASQDDYYVEFKTSSGGGVGNGSWIECVGFDIEKGFDSSTMPFSIINDNQDSFVISEVNYTNRIAGDNLSNPNPSFVGREITNMFFFKNRLGFLSGDNVIFSEAGLGGEDENNLFAYNFYRNTVSSLLDSAPIDISVSSRRVTTLESAVGFQDNLVLFSRTGQFVLKGADVLTPKTVSITPATNFDYDETVPPLPLGSYIYYPFKRGSFTGLREFTVNASTDNYDSAEVTEHVPAYIPSNLVQMKGTTSEDIIALVSGNEPDAIYIYNYFWNNNQKVLSAWSKFTFAGEIRGMEFIESTLYAVITHNDETNIVEMPLESGLSDNAGYVTHLDNRVASTVTNGSSTITLPYTPEDNSVEVYTTDGLALNCTNSGATVTLSNPVTSDTDVWVGVPYTMKYTFSEQLFKAKAGNGKSPSNAAKMMIRNGSLYYDKSAYFKVKVTPKFRDTYENIFTPDVVGSSTLGSLSLDSGFYRFPVFTKAQDTTITIENESALPSTFQSAEFESFVHSRSNRYG